MRCSQPELECSAALQDQGYAFAKVDTPVAYQDQTQPLLDVTFHVETGPQVNIGANPHRGTEAGASRSVVLRRLLLHTGELYRRERDRARSRRIC